MTNSLQRRRQQQRQRIQRRRQQNKQQQQRCTFHKSMIVIRTNLALKALSLERLLREHHEGKLPWKQD